MYEAKTSTRLHLIRMEAAHVELLSLAHVDARNVSQVRMEALGAVDEVDVVEPVPVLVVVNLGI